VPRLDKTANPAEGSTVEIGDTITYSVAVTNTGGSTFTGPMTDTLPTGFQATGTISDGGILSADGRSITWQVTLEAGASKTFTYAGVVTDAAAGDLVNVVVLTTPAGPLTDQTTHPVFIVEEIEEVEEVVAGEEIADTGADNVGTLVATAILAMVLGGLMVTFDRRRRRGEG
jgi:uncharacterized repeat protein (TIGR01451 family)